MGQYYKPVNLDNKQYLYSHDYSCGLKLMEHSYIGNPLMNVVEKLLAEGGDWHKARIVWAGDYADEGNFLDPEAAFADEDGNVRLCKDITAYSLMYHTGEQIRPGSVAMEGAPYEIRERVAVENKRDISLNYICNWDKLEFVDLSKVQPIGDEGWEAENYIHPLSLLVSDGNGRGGGDFRGENEHVGRWAGDRISVEPALPAGFVLELIPQFKEG